MIVNANSLVEHEIQIKNGIINHVNMSVKVVIRAKRFIVRRGHVFERMASI